MGGGVVSLRRSGARARCGTGRGRNGTTGVGLAQRACGELAARADGGAGGAKGEREAARTAARNRLSARTDALKHPRPAPRRIIAVQPLKPPIDPKVERDLKFAESRGSLRRDELDRLKSEIDIKRRSFEQAAQAVDIARSKLAREQEAAAPGPARSRTLLNAADAELRGAPASIGDAERARLRKDATSAAGAGADKEAKRIRKEQEALVKSTQGAVGELSLRAAKKEATDLDAALEAVNQQYLGLFDSIEKIRAFNPGEAEALKFQADAEKQRLKDAIRADFDLKAAGEKVKALEAERDAQLDLQRIRAGDDPAAQAQLIRDQAATTAVYTERIIEATRAEEALALAQNKTLVAAKAKASLTVLGATDPQRVAQQAELKALQLELSRLTAERDARITAAQLQANINDPTGLTARQAEIDLLTEYQGKLQDIVARAREMAVALGDPTVVANLDATAARLTVLDQQTLQVRDSLVQTFASGLVDAFASADTSFGDFARSFIRNILLMIAQARVLQAIQSSPGLSSIFGALAGAVTGGKTPVAVQHTGGMAGASGVTRNVPSAWFASARRYHTGGLPGLRADEVPAILQKGEEVLARNSARNVLNGGGAQRGQDIKIINTIDPGEVASAGLGTQAGQRALINAMSLNRTTIKKVLG